MFFNLKDFEFNWNTLDDLKGMTIGGTLGHTYPDEFLAAEKKGLIDIGWASSDEINLRKLLAGRFQIFPVDQNIGYYLLKTKFSSGEVKRVTHHPKQLWLSSINMLFPKNQEQSKKLLEIFDQGLKQLKESGKFDQYTLESQRGEYIRQP